LAEQRRRARQEAHHEHERDRELVIGLVLALALALPVHALRWAGALIHSAAFEPIGGSFEHDGSAPPALEQLYGLLAIALFMTLGGHRLAIAAIAESLRSAPLGTLASFGDPAQLALSSARLLGD